MLYYIKTLEIGVTMFIQTYFRFMEQIFEIISVEFGPTVLLSYGVPLLGCTDMSTMVKSSLIMGLLALAISAAKWIFPGDRPFWWVRENSLPDIRQHRLSCETTGGFPSGHSAHFSAFIYIALATLLPIIHKTCDASIYESFKYYGYWLASILCVLMWTSRVYFGCHFVHQCIFGTLLAVWLVQSLNGPRMELNIFTMHRNTAVLILLGFGICLILLYFMFLNADIDPHWSVRMAFKSCDFPEHLKHETSPIYSIAKDYGFLMGIALSSPLLKRTKYVLDFKFSLPVTLVIIMANAYLNALTPKQSGRTVFVIYGFIRNLLFAYALLNIMPFLSCKSINRPNANILTRHHLD